MHANKQSSMFAYVIIGVIIAFMVWLLLDPSSLLSLMQSAIPPDEVADERAGEVLEAYMKVAQDEYRNHPFYERAEQVAKLRRALKDIAIQPPSPEENLR